MSNLKLLENTLAYSVEKQKAISENIANASTHGYKRKDVEFDNYLTDAMNTSLKTSSGKHMSVKTDDPKNGVKVVLDENTENISGVNNVDANKEMAELAKNQLLFRFSSKKINAHFGAIQNVIRGGR
ncbi:MAG: flagellar basal body rod protein FlgB [Melioribacteraceae bacterium]|nr:flagellar basal body rod protein FlgB [Melioribacteraceae bacterium]